MVIEGAAALSPFASLRGNSAKGKHLSRSTEILRFAQDDMPEPSLTI